MVEPPITRSWEVSDGFGAIARQPGPLSSATAQKIVAGSPPGSSEPSTPLPLSDTTNMLRSGSQASKKPSSTSHTERAGGPEPQQPQPHIPISQKLRVYHDDQPYVGLALHESSSTIKSLLPSPPTSPIPSRRRFRIRKPHLSLPLPSLYSFKLVLRDFFLQIHARLPGTPRLPDKFKNSPLLWIFLYFALNLSLTLYNKYVLIHFPFPYTLTALHALCGSAGTFVMLHLGLTTDPPIPNLSLKESTVLVLFSLLYTVNIVVSNASLKLVTVPFHQVVRGSAPLFTIALSAILYRKGCSRAKLVSLLPVIAGVGFATYGDYYFTLFGFLITILGTLLAALKTILTNQFLSPPGSNSSPNPLTKGSDGSAGDTLSTKHQKVPSIFRHLRQTDSQYRLTTARLRFNLPKLSLTPLQLLYLMSPLAFIQTTMMAHMTGELDRVNRHLANPQLPHHSGNYNPVGIIRGSTWWLILNGILAFALNVVSFNSNKRIGPLGMTVAANVKQVLTVLCAVGLFNLTITFTNGIGIVLTLIGGAWYAYVEVQEKKQTKRSG